MSQPRLLFISNLFPDQAEPYRGLDNATILHHLSGEFEIRVLSPRPTLFRTPVRRAREVDAGFAPVYVPSPYVPKVGSRFNPALMARALREPVAAVQRTWPFDVVLSSWIFPDSCAVATLANDFPLVSIAQGTDVHQYLKVPARRKVIAQAMQRASAIITRSAALGQLLAEAGLAPERLHPVYNGIDFTRFCPGDPLAAREALGLPLHGPMILFVGNFLPIKNPLLLLRAHAQLTSAHLVMVGGGPLEEKARALAGELGTAGRITFAGRRSAEEVARFMRAADVLALPSHNEGVPNVILEAFASGLRVVASRVGGISEVHDRACLGSLVPAGDLDALVHTLRHALETPVQSEAIRRHALQFSWEAAALKYSGLLKAAILEGARPHCH